MTKAEFMTSKIATCCYCGTRAALVLTEAGRHELSCAACGAPLHEMKAMPVRKAERLHQAPPRRAGAPARPDRGKPRKKPAKRRDRMRKFSPMRAFSRALEQAWDEIEDIFG